MNPYISVIIPTYNRENFIIECLNSVYNQTYKNFECILIDDGSNDKTKFIIENLQYPLRYFFQKNKGPSSARNLGILHSKGDYIAFLDSDDLWLPNKLEKQVQFFHENKEAYISYTEEIWYRKGKRVNPCKKHKKYSGYIYDKLLPLCLISPSSVMIKKNVFYHTGYFDEELPACEDYDLWLRIGNKFPILLLNDPLIIKRNGHSDHQSQKFFGLDRFRIMSLKKMIESGDLNESNLRATKEILFKKCNIYINGCIKRNKIEEAKTFENIISSC